MSNLQAAVERAIEIGRNGQYEALTDAFEMIREIEKKESIIVDVGLKSESVVLNPLAFEYAHNTNKVLRGLAVDAVKDGTGGQEMLDLYWRCLLFDAPYDFDSFCLYIEKNREPSKKFYQPRRKQLLPAVEALQELVDDKLDLLCISEPPGVGKTTLAIFFLCFIEGQRPDLTVLGGSHSNSFLRGVYDEIQRILTPNGEYCYTDVFPSSPMVSTDAKDMRIDLQKRKRFQSFEFSSIGSGNAGKVRASRLLYCDDLVDGIETAMNPQRLEKLYQQYYTDLRQRKIGACKELHIATRWSVNDIIGHLEREYGDNPRAKFIAFSALDDNDESNYDYPYGLGFTTQFYKDQRSIMDDVSWKALYCNEPIEREGLLYHPDDLQRFYEEPTVEPDGVVAVLDTKNLGDDFYAMPIAYQYGRQFYIVDVIYDNGLPNVVEPRIVDKLVRWGVKLLRVEANAAGSRIAENIQAAVKERNGITQVTTKWNQTNKLTRIIYDSGFVKDSFLFRDESLYKDNKEYRKFITDVCAFTQSGKNKHDDAVDSLSMLANFVQRSDSAVVKLFKRTF